MMNSIGERPRVLMLGPSLDSQGGIASVANALMRSDLNDYCALSYIPTTVDGSRFRKMAVAIRSLSRYRRAVKECDLVHVHFSYGVSMLRKSVFIKHARRAGKKVILHCHSSEIEKILQGGSETAVLRLRSFLLSGDAVIVMSGYWEQLLNERLLLPEGLVVVIPNGVSVQEVRSPHIHDGVVRVLYLGRLEQEKGIDILLEGLSAISREAAGNKVALTLAGTGSPEVVDDYRSFAEESGLSCNFFGWADASDKKDLLCSSDVLVLPSRREVFPMVLLEAMSLGVPCIASDCGSIPDIIQDGVSGVLFQTGSVESFVRKAAPLLANAGLRKSCSAKAHETVASRFDISRVVRLISGLYERVLRG